MDNRGPSNERKSISLLVKLARDEADDFVEKYATNLSSGGMFIWSREPTPVGTALWVRVELAGGARVLQGKTVVRWSRPPNSPHGPPGMGLEFIELDPASAALIDRLLAGEPPSAAAQAEGVTVEIPPAAMEAVDVDLDVLIEETPAPDPNENTVFVDPSLFEPEPAKPAAPSAPSAFVPRPAPKRRSEPQLPRGVLSAAPAVSGIRAPGLPVFLKTPAAIDGASPLVGIDLGTTNSCCAVLSGGKPVVLKTKDGYNLIPSLIALNAQDKLVVGHAARAQLLLNPAQCIYGAKRLVGRDYDSPTVSLVRERFHYEIVAAADGKAAVILGGKVVGLDEVQALVLNECRLMAEAHLGVPVRRAVVTCPAYYSEQQREAVRRAGTLAGLKVERILNEPTAAALAYGLNRELSRKVLVYDVGGGTFDATLLRIEKNVFEVLATGGDVFLGGLDFDNQVIDALLMKFQAQNGVPFEPDLGALARVADQAEKAKIALSERQSIEVDLPMLQVNPRGAPLGLKCVLSRSELERLTAGLVDRTLEVVGDVLLDAGLKASEIDEVVLVGGMSRMPMVREKLKTMFKKPPHASVHAEEAIAVGAALFTGAVDKVSNVVLIDVVPMTLGVGMPGGAFKRLVPRNTPLPASASFGFATTQDNEEVLEVQVFQGEDADLSVNDYLGTVRVDGLPRAPKGVVKVAINLRLDAQCVLHVEAREMHTRRLFKATLATRYTSGEVQQKLGIPAAAPTAAATRRAEELKERGGTVWGLLKRVIRRR